MNPRKDQLLRDSTDDPQATINPQIAVDQASTDEHQSTDDPLNTVDPLAEDDPLTTADPLQTFDPDMPTDSLATAVVTADGTLDSGTVIELDQATLGEDAQSQFFEVCQRFERAWNEGDQEPSFEQFLPKNLDQGLRQTLVHQLVRIDVGYRKKRHKSLQPKEYLSILPDCGEAIQAALSNRKSSVPRGYGSVDIPLGATDARQLHHVDDQSTRYRQTKFLARGGLGAVYHAHDEELFRQVALKEILPEHASDRHLQDKFLFEAEVTGFLEHPGIVPVYGLGRYEDDQPYYAMRFIRGRSFREVIEAFHRENPSPSAGTYYTREFQFLLRRLIETCNAVHYAHEHGVLHRDIKPDNVMLGDYGETLVVDWGLAMLADTTHAEGHEDAGSNDAKFSGSGRYSTRSRSSRNCAVGTPMFMSPEQANGRTKELDGRTDIYSLGAVLFNIVCGEYTIEGNTTWDIIVNVRAGKTRNLHSLVPSAPKALASICKKAMALSPADRYATATELADDIDRWMNDEIVYAHIGHEPVAERAGRLIRRYRSWTISGAAALLIITTVAIVSALMINSAKRKEEIAKLQATESKQDAVARYRDSRDAIDTWLVQSSDALEYFPGTQDVRARLLTLATEDYAKLAESSSRDPELELERGRTLLALGQLLQMQKNFEAATNRYREALELFGADVADDTVARAYRRQQAESHRRIGLALDEQNDTARAKQEYQLAIDQLKELTSEADDPHALRILATTRNNVGELEYERDPEAAIDYLQDSLRDFHALDADSDSENHHDIARTHELLGRVYAKLGDHTKADKEFSTAVEVLQKLVKKVPDHPKYLSALASAYVSHAVSYRARGMQNQVIESLQQAASEYRALRRAMPDVPAYTHSLAIALVDLGLALHDDDQDQLAGEHLWKAYELSSELVGTYGKDPGFGETLAASADGLGQVLLVTQEDTARTMEAFDLAISECQKLVAVFPDHAPYSERLGIVESHCAQALARDERYQDARTFFEESLKVLGELIDADQGVPRYANARAHVHYRFALMLHHQNDEQAKTHFESARDAWLTLGESGPASYLHDLAWLLATCPVDSVRDAENAARFAQQATDLVPENARYQTTFALSALLAGDVDKAVIQIDRARQLRAEPIGRDLFVLAMIQARQGNQAAAQTSLDQAKKWVEANQPFDPDLQRLRQIAEDEVTSDQED